MAEREWTLEERVAVMDRALMILDGGNRWVKGKWKQTKRVKGEKIVCYCVEGAIHKAAIDLGLREKFSSVGASKDTRLSSFSKWIKSKKAPAGTTMTNFDGTWRGVPYFNDAKGTTWKMVERQMTAYTNKLLRELDRKRTDAK